MPRLCMFGLVSFLAFGCGSGDRALTVSTYRSESGRGHSHERGKLLLADAGRYHAGLTAHLSSKEGNELDVIFETADAEPKPVPLPLARYTADGQAHELVFEPAPKDERKDDPDGKCSHFSAKAAWMKANDVLTVSGTIPIEGKLHAIEWKDFNPKKYAHFEE